MMKRAALEIVGILVILFTVREIFRDIFHPTHSGTLSDFIGSGTSCLLRRYKSLRPAVGPVALVGVIWAWVTLISLGFALIYLGLYPTYFLVPAAEQDTSLGAHFLRSLYFSLGALDTFQTFELSPRSLWLRLIVAFEGLIGISMITASVSWLVLIYPALGRTRRLARRIFVLIRAEERSGIAIEEVRGAQAFSELANDLIQVRLDLILFPFLLNFYSSDEFGTLAAALPHLPRLIERATASDKQEDVRFSATELRVSLEDFSQMLAERVFSLKETDQNQVLQRYAEREMF